MEYTHAKQMIFLFISNLAFTRCSLFYPIALFLGNGFPQNYFSQVGFSVELGLKGMLSCSLPYLKNGGDGPMNVDFPTLSVTSSS